MLKGFLWGYYARRYYALQGRDSPVPSILILPCRGGIPLCLKGFSLGILCKKKRGMVFFWGKDIEK